MFTFFCYLTWVFVMFAVFSYDFIGLLLVTSSLFG